MSVELVGWLASTLFLVHALPLLWCAVADGHVRHLNALYLWTWIVAEVLSVIYVSMKHGLDMPLLTNYVINGIIAGLLLKYKYYPRRNVDE